MTAETTDSEISSKTQMYTTCPDVSLRCLSHTEAAAECEFLFWIRIYFVCRNEAGGVVSGSQGNNNNKK